MQLKNKSKAYFEVINIVSLEKFYIKNYILKTSDNDFPWYLFNSHRISLFDLYELSLKYI